MSSLVITIDDTSDIVMSATPGATEIGIEAFTEPAIVESVSFASGGSPYLDWQTPVARKREMALLSFVVAPFGAASEAEADTLIEALRESVRRLGFNVTVAQNGVVKTWWGVGGSVTPAAPRTRINLDLPNLTEWNVSIPCSLVEV